MSLYSFQCPEHEEEILEIDIPMNDIQDVQQFKNGKEPPKCSICQQHMKRLYSFPHIRKYKGLITPSEVRTADGKVHKLSSNLWRN